MTIGDILAVIAALLLMASSWGATILLTAMLFPQRVERAREELMARPVRCFWRGAGSTGVIILLALPALGQPGPVRLISLLLWGLLAAFGAIGGAAISRILSLRIGGEGSELAPFARLTRSVALYVGAGFLPVIGWFVVTPAALLMSAGAAVSTMRPRRALAYDPATTGGMAAPFAPEARP
jgi:hypothetical protein